MEQDLNENPSNRLDWMDVRLDPSNLDRSVFRRPNPSDHRRSSWTPWCGEPRVGAGGALGSGLPRGPCSVVREREKAIGWISEGSREARTAKRHARLAACARAWMWGLEARRTARDRQPEPRDWARPYGTSVPVRDDAAGVACVRACVHARHARYG